MTSGHGADPGADVDDLIHHFYSTVGQLLDHAALGGLRVELELAGGRTVAGVPARTDALPDDELDDTGYPRHFLLDGAIVALASVQRAAVMIPGGVVDSSRAGV
jgi:hypothetical protein